MYGATAVVTGISSSRADTHGQHACLVQSVTLRNPYTRFVGQPVFRSILNREQHHSFFLLEAEHEVCRLRISLLGDAQRRSVCRPAEVHSDLFSWGHEHYIVHNVPRSEGGAVHGSLQNMRRSIRPSILAARPISSEGRGGILV